PMYYVAPSLNDLLSSTRETWWGVFTSMFVHSGIEHFANNMGSLFLFLLLFAISNEHFSPQDQRARASFFRWNLFGSAILANVLFLLRFNVLSRGASGIVFAAEGLILGFAFVIAFPPSFARGELRKHFLSNENKKRTLRNLAIFVVLFGWFVISPGQFLFAGPGVNSLVHFYAFYIGFASAGAYEIVRRYKKDLVR